jgi:decaprenyl-phosphate phosphoribosyltransferase
MRHIDSGEVGTAIRNYLAIARPGHWFKNIFMLPGVAIAMALTHRGLSLGLAARVVSAVMAACLIASANYTINEWLDAKTDLHHPKKKHRPSVAGTVHAPLVYIQWLALATAGLAIAYQLNTLFFGTALLFLVMGIVYNVPPLRFKDRPYLDVLSEAINNPIRLVLGWCTIVEDVIPPSSILIAYWMCGAFLMAVKRYSEVRYIDNPQQAGRYRKSFIHYNEKRLLLSSFFYALTATFLLGVFLIKYRVEFVIAVPFISALFVWYLHLGMAHESVAQSPEQLYRHRAFIGYVCFLTALLIVLALLDIPSLNILLRVITVR